MKFIPIKYGATTYPAGIEPEIVEVSATFNSFKSKNIPHKTNYSLHTEPFLKKSDFKSQVYNENIEKYQTVLTTKLWSSKEWAKYFADFIISGVEGAKETTLFPADIKDPSIIEIHPPKKNDCDTLELFLERYRLFETAVKEHYPDTQILIENRTSGGIFLMRTSGDIKILSEKLDKEDLGLRIIADFPQLITAMCSKEEGNVLWSEQEIDAILKPLRKCKNIKGIHISGKSHNPDLNTLFGDIDLKDLFFEKLLDVLANHELLYFLPEINGNGRDAIAELIDKHNFKFKT